MKYSICVEVMHFIATLDVGGAEKQLLLLCREQIKNNYHVKVVPLKGNNTLALDFTSSKVTVVDKLRGKSLPAQFCLVFAMRLRNPNWLLHAHSAKAQMLIALLPLRLSKSFIVSKHDAMRFLKSVPNLVSKLSWRFVSYRASKVILISQSILDSLNSRRPITNQTKFVVCHYGISKDEIQLFKQAKEEKNVSATRRPLTFGTVGRLVNEKNHGFLIEAFNEFQKSYPESELFICGYGVLEGKLKELINTLQLSAKVRIFNNLEPQRFYNKLDVFILPSKTEGFGLVLLEAMASNLMIIASKVGAIPEVLGADCGYLFPVDEPATLIRLMHLATDPLIREEESLKSSVRLESFDSQRMFTCIDSVYVSLV